MLGPEVTSLFDLSRYCCAALLVGLIHLLFLLTDFETLTYNIKTMAVVQIVFNFNNMRITPALDILRCS